MHHGFALRYIPEVMKWSPERENAETVWLRLMSEFKFDSYQDFLSGSRFVESLLDWLQQFAPEDRETAYELVREHMIFISFSELQHLVRRAFPAFIRPFQAQRAARKLGVPDYLVWSTEAAVREAEAVSKRSLFIGLSDGARMDSFRRANAGLISNEQIILAYEVSDGKWSDVHNELKKRTDDPHAKFEIIALLDDFAGSGTTLIRRDDSGQTWKGKLQKINEALSQYPQMLAEDCDVLIHHYIGTDKAHEGIEAKLNEAGDHPALKRLFQGKFECTFDLQLSAASALTPGKSPKIDALVSRYYDPAIMTPSLLLGAVDAMHGFARCGLPLVMEHNTPNNSLALFWAESLPVASPTPHQMRPLFRRRQRHF